MPISVGTYMSVSLSPPVTHSVPRLYPRYRPFPAVNFTALRLSTNGPPPLPALLSVRAGKNKQGCPLRRDQKPGPPTGTGLANAWRLWSFRSDSRRTQSRWAMDVLRLDGQCYVLHAVSRPDRRDACGLRVPVPAPFWARFPASPHPDFHMPLVLFLFLKKLHRIPRVGRASAAGPAWLRPSRLDASSVDAGTACVSPAIAPSSVKCTQSWRVLDKGPNVKTFSRMGLLEG